MTRSTEGRRRPAIHITLNRAARLYRLVRTLAEAPRTREELLKALGMGLRTFYRELDLLKRFGVRLTLEAKRYRLRDPAEESLGRLPFPDPQLTVAEMTELVRGQGAAARRLAELLARVTGPAAPAGARRKAAPKRRTSR